MLDFDILVFFNIKCTYATFTYYRISSNLKESVSARDAFTYQLRAASTDRDAALEAKVKAACQVIIDSSYQNRVFVVSGSDPWAATSNITFYLTPTWGVYRKLSSKREDLQIHWGARC